MTRACSVLVAFGALTAGVAASEATVCDGRPVLTAIATDTETETTLFSLAGPPDQKHDWLVVLDARQHAARLFPDPFADLRTGASHGPGPFLAASRCGDDCFQPMEWKEPGWQPLGHPIEFDPNSTLHLTHDRAGSPWLVFHQLTERKGVLAATAYRWTGETWDRRGRLLVQGVGSPGATHDPREAGAILSGTGRFGTSAPPDYWLPALPVLPRSTGGQVIALPGGAAAFLTFDSRVVSSRDGATWQLERWTPWPNPLGRSDLWVPGTDYSVDRTGGGGDGVLTLLWYDDRQTESPALHLTRWLPATSWSLEATLELPALPGSSVDHVVNTVDRGWLLVGPCHSSESDIWLEGLALEPGSTALFPLRIPLKKGWRE